MESENQMGELRQTSGWLMGAMVVRRHRDGSVDTFIGITKDVSVVNLGCQLDTPGKRESP